MGGATAILQHVHLLMCTCARAQPHMPCMRRNKPNLLSFNSRVSFVGVGFIKLDRTLPYNVSTKWSPGLHIFDCKCSCAVTSTCHYLDSLCIENSALHYHLHPSRVSLCRCSCGSRCRFELMGLGITMYSLHTQCTFSTVQPTLTVLGGSACSITTQHPRCAGTCTFAASMQLGIGGDAKAAGSMLSLHALHVMCRPNSVVAACLQPVHQ